MRIKNAFNLSRKYSGDHIFSMNFVLHNVYNNICPAIIQTYVQRQSELTNIEQIFLSLKVLFNVSQRNFRIKYKCSRVLRTPY